MSRYNGLVRRELVAYFWAPLFLFLGVLGLYGSSLPQVNTGLADSDELITVAKILGVAHPPGYPLYSILAIFVSRLPLPFTFAGRVNFLSSLLQAGTVVFVFLSGYLVIKKFYQDLIISLALALLGALSLAMALSFWFYALVAEVFALHLFLASVVLFGLVLWEKKGATQDKLLYLAAFGFGLGVSNQQVFVLLLPAFALWALWTKPKMLGQGRFLLKLAGIALVGLLLPYLYLPLAARNQAVINWESPRTLPGVARTITRRIYAESAPHGFAYLGGKISWARSLAGFEQFGRFLLANYSWPVFSLGLVGLVFLWRRKEYRLLMLLVLGVIGGGFFLAVYVPVASSRDAVDYRLAAGVHQRLYLASLLFYSPMISLGVAAALITLKRFWPRLAAWLVMLLIFLPLSAGYDHYQEIVKTNFALGHSFGKALLESLEPEAILICFVEQACFTGTYLQQVEGVRPDVLIIPADFAQWPVEQIRKDYPELIRTAATKKTPKHSILFVRDLIRWQIDQRPIYIAGINNQSQVLSAYGLDQDPFYLIPYGCAMKVAKSFQLAVPDQECLSLDDQLSASYLTPKVPITDMFPAYLTYQHFFSGLLYAGYDCRQQARLEFSQALKLNPKFNQARQALAKLQDKPAEGECQPGGPGPGAAALLAKASQSEQDQDLESALYYAVQASSLAPAEIKIRLKLAGLYLQAQAVNNARIEYRDILVLDPDNQEAQAALSRLENS